MEIPHYKDLYITPSLEIWGKRNEKEIDWNICLYAVDCDGYACIWKCFIEESI